MSGSKGQEIVYTWARLNTPTHKELSDTIDAALRRAKAEVWREAAKAYAHKVTYEPITDEQFDDYCLARAAQIEADYE